jgi:lambda family phage portal protein
VICTGMRPQAVVTKSNGGPNALINKALDEGWSRYNDEWDRRGAITFYEAERLALKTIIISGGILSNTVRSTSGRLLPIAKQMIEPDRLDTSHDDERRTMSDNAPARQTLHGISVDEYGAPVGYWIDGITNIIPAKNIIHAFVHERPEQYIGVPWGAPVLELIWDIHQLQEDTLIKSRALADVVWWMRKANEFTATTDSDDNENRIVEALSFLETPEEPKVIKGDDSITESVQPLVKMITHSICAGFGTSYMTVTRDLTDVNFAASRSVVLEERRYYRAVQKWFAKSFCQREWEDFVFWMVQTDQIPGLTSEIYARNPHKYNQCWWKAEAWDWVDPAKDTQADSLMDEKHLATHAELLAKRGKSVEDHYRDLEEQKRLQKQYGIEDLFQPKTPAAAGAPAKQDKKDNQDGGDE